MATTVTKKTYADWISEIEGCGDDLSRDELINLVFAEGPNASWSDMVREMQAKYYYSMYNYLKGMFPMTGSIQFLKCSFALHDVDFFRPTSNAGK